MIISLSTIEGAFFLTGMGIGIFIGAIIARPK